MEDLPGVPLLIFANKTDLPGAISPTEMPFLLDVHALGERAWHLEGTYGGNGAGCYEGLDWLSQELEKGKAKRP